MKSFALTREQLKLLGHDDLFTGERMDRLISLFVLQESSESNSARDVLRISKDKQHAESYKLYHVILNWGRLFDSIPQIVFASASASTAHWLIPFAGLLICKELLGLTKIELDKVHAIILWVLWEYSNSKPYFSMEEEILFIEVNKELFRGNAKEILLADFKSALTSLEHMKSIERFGTRILLLESSLYPLSTMNNHMDL